MSTAKPNSTDWPHLVRRFFSSWRPRRLSPSEQSFVAGLLQESETDAFWSQQTTDVRHAHDCARMVSSSRPGRVDLARAALLHDIGKRTSRLGPLGRTMATILARVGIRGSRRHDSYTRHSEEGAALLTEAGAEDIVVDYTRHHHQERPESIDQADWDLLMTADQNN